MPGIIATRPYHPTDRAVVLDFVAALQDFERTLHDSRRLSSEMAEAYLAYLEEKVATSSGQILLVDGDEKPAGFVCCWVEVEDDPALSDDARRYGYISDVFVISGRRRQGIGGQLLTAAEAHLHGLGMTRILIWSLAANGDARAVYERNGYTTYEIVYEKQFGTRVA